MRRGDLLILAGLAATLAFFSMELRVPLLESFRELLGGAFDAVIYIIGVASIVLVWVGWLTRVRDDEPEWFRFRVTVALGYWVYGISALTLRVLLGLEGVLGLLAAFALALPVVIPFYIISKRMKPSQARLRAESFLVAVIRARDERDKDRQFES